MARLLTCGWEAGFKGENIPNLSAGAATKSLVTTTVRSGTYAIEFNSGASDYDQDQIIIGTLGRGYFTSFYMRFPSAPGASASIAGLGSTSYPEIAVRLNSDRTVSLTRGTAFTVVATSAVLDLDTWHRIDFRGKITNTTSDEGELKVNGVTVGSFVADAGINVAGNVLLGWGSALGGSAGSNKLVFYDDLVVNDDQGATENSWPTSDKLALLVPTAQNFVTASTWQKPGGATTNMHTSVDNIPPVGVANSTNAAQAENQIRNAVSNNAADVRFDMTTYTAAGIGASDTINATQAFALVGLATTATTKQGSLEVISNPAQAEVNFGAYGTGTAVGTFPTGWQRRTHTITQTPSVTVTDAPLVELGQRTANTTIAQCCFVGLYVDYTPGAAPPAERVPYRNIMPPLIAQ